MEAASEKRRVLFHQQWPCGYEICSVTSVGSDGVICTTAEVKDDVFRRRDEIKLPYSCKRAHREVDSVVLVMQTDAGESTMLWHADKVIQIASNSSTLEIFNGTVDGEGLVQFSLTPSWTHVFDSEIIMVTAIDGRSVVIGTRDKNLHLIDNVLSERSVTKVMQRAVFLDRFKSYELMSASDEVRNMFFSFIVSALDEVMYKGRLDLLYKSKQTEIFLESTSANPLEIIKNAPKPTSLAHARDVYRKLYDLTDSGIIELQRKGIPSDGVYSRVLRAAQLKLKGISDKFEAFYSDPRQDFEGPIYDNLSDEMKPFWKKVIADYFKEETGLYMQDFFVYEEYNPFLLYKKQVLEMHVGLTLTADMIEDVHSPKKMFLKQAAKYIRPLMLRFPWNANDDVVTMSDGAVIVHKMLSSQNPLSNAIPFSESMSFDESQISLNACRKYILVREEQESVEQLMQKLQTRFRRENVGTTSSDSNFSIRDNVEKTFCSPIQLNLSESSQSIQEKILAVFEMIAELANIEMVPLLEIDSKEKAATVASCANEELAILFDQLQDGVNGEKKGVSFFEVFCSDLKGLIESLEEQCAADPMNDKLKNSLVELKQRRDELEKLGASENMDLFGRDMTFGCVEGHVAPPAYTGSLGMGDQSGRDRCSKSFTPKVRKLIERLMTIGLGIVTADRLPLNQPGEKKTSNPPAGHPQADARSAALGHLITRALQSVLQFSAILSMGGANRSALLAGEVTGEYHGTVVFEVLDSAVSKEKLKVIVDFIGPRDAVTPRFTICHLVCRSPKLQLAAEYAVRLFGIYLTCFDVGMVSEYTELKKAAPVGTKKNAPTIQVPLQQEEEEEALSTFEKLMARYSIDSAAFEFVFVNGTEVALKVNWKYWNTIGEARRVSKPDSHYMVLMDLVELFKNVYGRYPRRNFSGNKQPKEISVIIFNQRNMNIAEFWGSRAWMTVLSRNGLFSEHATQERHDRIASIYKENKGLRLDYRSFRTLSGLLNLCGDFSTRKRSQPKYLSPAVFFGSENTVQKQGIFGLIDGIERCKTQLPDNLRAIVNAMNDSDSKLRKLWDGGVQKRLKKQRTGLTEFYKAIVKQFEDLCKELK